MKVPDTLTAVGFELWLDKYLFPIMGCEEYQEIKDKDSWFALCILVSIIL